MEQKSSRKKKKCCDGGKFFHSLSATARGALEDLQSPVQVVEVVREEGAVVGRGYVEGRVFLGQEEFLEERRGRGAEGLGGPGAESLFLWSGMMFCAGVIAGILGRGYYGALG